LPLGTVLTRPSLLRPPAPCRLRHDERAPTWLGAFG